jgi:hypothetical protein
VNEIEREMLFGARFAAGPRRSATSGFVPMGYMSDEGITKKAAEWVREREEKHVMTNLIIQHPRRYGRQEILANIKAARDLLNATKQTVLCHPSLREQVEAHIRAEGLENRVSVVQTPYLPPDCMYVHPSSLLTEEVP